MSALHRGPQLAAAVAASAPSGIRDVSNVALTIPNAIRLDLGQPDFATPEHIRQGAMRAIDEGWTGYTHTQGLASLRELLAEKLARVNDLSVSPDEIACAGGGVGAVAAAMAAVLGPGDEALVPDPGWPNYRMICAWLGATPVPYRCPGDLAFEPDLDALERAITPRTRLLIVNSPSNPTGAVFSRSTIESLCDLAVRHGLWLLSDECYDEIVFDAEAVSPATLLADQVISVYSFSKTYAMTGWRLGYVAAGGPVLTSIAKVLESSTSCPSSVSQKAAEAALAGPQDCVAEMTASYRARRDLAVSLLADAGMLVTAPRGAFYIMADVSGSREESDRFALRLLRERGVSVAPGTAFGRVAGNAIRIALSAAEADLREGIGRIADDVAKAAARSR
jgi:aspartate aminotransferase